MRSMPTEARPPRARRLRGIAITAAVVLLILFLSFRGLAVFFTDYLWFRSVDLAGAWRGLLGAKIALGTVFTLAFFLLMFKIGRAHV